MEINLDREVAVVTGGTGALGRAVSNELARSGAKLSVPYIVDAEVPLFEKELGSLTSKTLLTKVDIFKWSEVQNFANLTLDKFGRVDILVNLVGGYFGGTSIHETEERDWDSFMTLNLKSHFLSCKAFLPTMLKQKYGRIVNVASESALKGEATLGVYSVSKSGVVRLTETIADEYRQEGITANAVLPRIIDTLANRSAMPDADFGKWPKPSEIASLICFLASDAARVVTGVSIPVIGLA
jgi:NAD(P)-dependent dehydrogenase (short-subunit alcohol dehydrogenase family)